MSYFKLRIKKIAASCPAKIHDEGRMYDRETIEGSTLEEALETLDDRIPVSLDSGSTVYRGESREVGKIYSFWKTTYSRQHGEVNTWERWWVELTEVEEEPIKPEAWTGQETNPAAMAAEEGLEG